MDHYSRRHFLHDSLMVATAAASVGSAPSLFAAPALSKEKGPNEKLQFAVIGVNGQGKGHIKNLLEVNNAEADLAIICDADAEVGKRRCDEIESQSGRRPKFVQDIRQVIDDSSIDCVSIAMPNHWHALASIWAMQAGKHVYVEKPVSHNVSEGRRMVEAARKYNRICQTGTQSRSNPGTSKAIEYIKSGNIGEVNLGRGLCYKLRGSIGPKGTYEAPKSLDYDLWCGPAPIETLTRPKLHYDWHWVWSTGNGDLGNQGIHQMDVARWGLGVDTLPQGVIAYGGRFGYEDAGETPNTHVTVLDYGPKTLVFEVRGLKSRALKGVSKGVIWEGTDGYVVQLGYTLSAAFDKNGKLVKRFEGSANHQANFIKAVRSGKKEDLTADILEGHLSSALCHLGNISYRLGQRLSNSEIAERLRNVKMSDNAQETLDRTADHLAQNDVQLSDATQFQCGEYLKFNAESEVFPDNSQANELLSREYRAPFVVPAAGKV